MYNARLLYIDDMAEARQQITDVGADKGSLRWLVPKLIHLKIKLEGVTPFAANIIKQEMLGAGGDAAVNKGAADFSIESSDVLVTGTLTQVRYLISKLKIQSGSLINIAAEIEEIVKGIENGRHNYFECKEYKLEIGNKTHIMGILNVTPDSFSDGGKYYTADSAVKRAKEMVEQGADIIDVGGESTRPGHIPVEAEEEAARILPVIEALVKELSVPISADTSKAYVAEKALAAGAHIINDVWGLQSDERLAGVISGYGAGVVMMHNRSNKDYADLMGEITGFLRKSIQIATNAGIKRECMCIDPGIGFGKTLKHNLEVMKRLRELGVLNLPVLLGTSRKSIVGGVLDLPLDQRVEGTAATVALGIAYGVDIIRVHDIKEMSRVARMTDAMVRINPGN